MRIDFTLTTAQHLAVIRHVQRRLLGKAARTIGARVLLVLTAIAALLVGVSLPDVVAHSTSSLAMTLVLSAIGLFVVSEACRRRIASSAMSLVAGENAATCTRCFVELLDTGVRHGWDEGELTIPWHAIGDVEEVEAMVLLGFSGRHRIAIPDAAFPSPESRAEFFRVLQASTHPRSADAVRIAPTEPLPAPGPAAIVDAESSETDAAGRTFTRAFGAALSGAIELATFRRVDATCFAASWTLVIALAGVGLLLKLAADILVVGLDGRFDFMGLSGAMTFVPIAVVAAWIFSAPSPGAERTLRTLVALLCVTLFVAAVELFVVAALYALAGEAALYEYWGTLRYVSVAWATLAVGVGMYRLVPIRSLRATAALVAGMAVLAAPALALYRYDSLWVPHEDESDRAARDQYLAAAGEQALYHQPELLEREIAAIQPGRAGTVDLYFVGAAGYGHQDVFMREVRSVAELFRSRFGTGGRSAVLINNPASIMSEPIASVTSLERVLDRVGAVMNRDEDVLFLYLTSHGSSDHRFSIELWPLRLDSLDPPRLKAMLDRSGIKWRVIVVSACYSGGFVKALADENTVVIAASAPDKQSFGCSNEASYTYFGRAYFEDGLRASYSFVEAFERARANVTHREVAERKTPSEPQLHAGAAIAAHLERLEARLENGGEPADPAPTPGVLPDARYDQLVKAMWSQDLVTEGRRVCLELMSRNGPEESVKREPGSFGGIVPGHRLWPQVVVAFDEYAQTICSAVEPQRMAQEQIDSWRRSLAPEQLDVALAFLRSEAGSAFAAAHRGTQVEILRSTAPLHARATDAAMSRYVSDMKRIQNQLLSESDRRSEVR